MKRCLPLLSLLVGCVPETVTYDAGSWDAGVVDASSPSRDAEPADAVAADAEATDAGEADSGVYDAGGVDATVRDAGSPDSGPAACSVAGLAFSCEDVTTCTGTPIYSACGPAPRDVCCVDNPTCSVSGAPGVCVDVGECPGVSTPGLCPGAANIQCCTRPEEACEDTSVPSPNVGLVEVGFDARCPDGMVVAGGFCVDVFEAALVSDDGTPWSPFTNPGRARVRAVSVAYAVPQAYISGDQAESACLAAGKRLCTDAEWLAACRGPAERVYPYGDTREDGRCNDAREQHPAIEYFGTADNSVFSMLDHPCIAQLPRSLALTGQHAGCESPVGAFDMMGNLHEWTSAASGTFRGGFFTDTFRNGEGCLYRTTAHGRGYWDYSTGFRCCADLR